MSKLVRYFRYLGLVWPHIPKMMYQFKKAFSVYQQAKNKLHPSCFPWDIAKILKSSCFCYFGSVWLRKPKVILSFCRKRLCLSAGKKPASFPMLLWRYCKDMQTYFGYFGHAWLHSPKMIVFNVYLHAKNKLHNSLLSYNITF